MHCTQTAQHSKMIFGGRAATVNASLVLKFGDNRPKGKGLEGVFWGELRKKSDYEKTARPIKTISGGFAAKAILNIVSRFGDNQPKVRAVTGGNFGKKTRKSLITQKREGQSR